MQPDDQAEREHEVTGDLRQRVLQCAIESAFRKKTVVEKTFRLRGEPKQPNQQRDEEKNLNQADLDSRDGRVPRERDAGGVDRAHHEEDERCKAQDRGRDCDEVLVDLKPAEKTADGIALQHPRDGEPGGEEGRRSEL